MTRRSCKTVYAGKLPIGGGAPVSVQSMLNVPAADIAGSVRQAKALAAAGCQLIRAAVPNKDAVRLIAALKEAGFTEIKTYSNTKNHWISIVATK